jgi:hypothetical protein
LPNGTLFQDMSGSAVTQALALAALQHSGAGANRDGVAGRREPGRRYAEGDRDGQACHLARHRRAFEVARIDVLITVVG